MSICQSCVQQGREHFSCFTWETTPKSRMAVLKINTRMGMLPQFPQLTVLREVQRSMLGEWYCCIWAAGKSSHQPDGPRVIISTRIPSSIFLSEIANHSKAKELDIASFSLSLSRAALMATSPGRRAATLELCNPLRLPITTCHPGWRVIAF